MSKSPDDAAIDGTADDRDPVTHPQVEGEPAATEPSDGDEAIHNAEAGPADAQLTEAGAESGPPEADDHPGSPAADEPAGKAAPIAPSPFRSVAWTLLDGDPAPDATELRIGFSLVARYESLARIDVRETASQVFVTVLSRFEPPAGGWFAYAEAHKATVALEAPLGDRALVHAPAQGPGRPGA